MNIRIITLLLSAYCNGLISCVNPEVQYDYIEIADRVRSQHIREMESESFTLTSFGGSMMYDVERLILGFRLSDTPTLEEARIMYMQGVERLLLGINQNEILRPYLHNYPFSLDNLEYTLCFKSISPGDSKSESIALVTNSGDRIYYSVYDPNFNFNGLKRIHKESYEDALRIMESQKHSLMKQK